MHVNAGSVEGKFHRDRGRNGVPQPESDARFAPGCEREIRSMDDDVEDPVTDHQDTHGPRARVMAEKHVSLSSEPASLSLSDENGDRLRLRA